MLIIILTIFIVLGLFVGFLFWVLASGTEIFVIVWSILGLLLFIIGIILLFIGGKTRRTLEKKMIEENNQRQMKMMKNGS